MLISKTTTDNKIGHIYFLVKIRASVTAIKGGESHKNKVHNGILVLPTENRFLEKQLIQKDWENKLIGNNIQIR